MLARHFAIATLGLPLQLDHPVQVCPPITWCRTRASSVQGSTRSIYPERNPREALPRSNKTPLKTGFEATPVDNLELRL